MSGVLQAREWASEPKARGRHCRPCQLNGETEYEMAREIKSLIAYFSRTGNNYVGGSIVQLPVGNTEVAA